MKDRPLIIAWGFTIGLILTAYLLAAGTCSSAHAMGGKDFPPQAQLAIPSHPHPDATLLEWLALIGPIGVGGAAVVGVVWEIYRRRKS